MQCVLKRGGWTAPNEPSAFCTQLTILYPVIFALKGHPVLVWTCDETEDWKYLVFVQMGSCNHASLDTTSPIDMFCKSQEPKCTMRLISIKVENSEGIHWMKNELADLLHLTKKRSRQAFDLKYKGKNLHCCFYISCKCISRFADVDTAIEWWRWGNLWQLLLILLLASAMQFDD